MKHLRETQFYIRISSGNYMVKTFRLLLLAIIHLRSNKTNLSNIDRVSHKKKTNKLCQLKEHIFFYFVRLSLNKDGKTFERGKSFEQLPVKWHCLNFSFHFGMLEFLRVRRKREVDGREGKMKESLWYPEWEKTFIMM